MLMAARSGPGYRPDQFKVCFVLLAFRRRFHGFMVKIAGIGIYTCTNGQRGVRAWTGGMISQHVIPQHTTTALSFFFI